MRLRERTTTTASQPETCDRFIDVMWFRATIAAIAAVVALATSSCGGEGQRRGDDRPPSTSLEADGARLADALCVASNAASEGDLEAARTTFDDVHTELHAYVAAVSDRDRQAAGEVLRAKERVESLLRRDDGQAVDERLEELSAAVSAAASAASVATSSPDRTATSVGAASTTCA